MTPPSAGTRIDTSAYGPTYIDPETEGEARVDELKRFALRPATERTLNVKTAQARGRAQRASGDRAEREYQEDLALAEEASRKRAATSLDGGRTLEAL